MNISCYRFAKLGGLKDLRAELLETCKAWGLKGTILLSTEGVNLFIAGPSENVDRLVSRLRRIPGLEDLQPKVSMSEEQPFNRMLVRIKREIIAFGVEGIDPTSPSNRKLPARELKRWLDEGRPLTLLDTRNDYELELGTFRGAIDPKIQTFRNFPDAVRKLPEEIKEQPVVIFCTGGIRCEKAGPFMEREGFKNVWQLDGGILKYFEEVGGDHYDGDCFVFDQRVGVDPALHETTHAVCLACRAPLTERDQKDSRYVLGKSCPHCFVDEARRVAERVSRLQARLDAATAQLPGAVPMENRRPVHIGVAQDKLPLVDALCELLPHVPRDEWERRIDAGRFVNHAGKPHGRDHVVRAGERVLQIFPAEVEPDVAAKVRVLFDDGAIIVVDKPAPLPVHPCGRFFRNTLKHFMDEACAPEVLRVVHRLDANTTGVTVFARTQRYGRTLQRAFAEGRVEKVYLARVQGHPAEDRFTCDARISRDAGACGLREVDEADGFDARTECRVIRRDEDGTALLEVTPLTGRTNQIRVHLWHIGHPLAGDPAYLPGGVHGSVQTMQPHDPPMMLHAWKLAFAHPATGEKVEFCAPAPVWGSWASS